MAGCFFSMLSLPNHMNIVTVPLPEHGAFNAGMASFRDGYIMVYRANDERSFVACALDRRFNPSEFQRLTIDCGADPRLIWHGGELICSYCVLVGGIETIFGKIIHDGDKFIDGKVFRISPETGEREKNWMPFTVGNDLFFIASVCPHIVYRWHDERCDECYETRWQPQWIYEARLRGNTNAVRLANGTYLATFHTVERRGKLFHYDNGAYVFSGEPPFNVIQSATRPYLPAEAATATPVRKAGIIAVCFPVGMVIEDDKLTISYGDNDSAVKVLQTTVEQVLHPTLPTQLQGRLNSRSANGFVEVTVLRGFLYKGHWHDPPTDDGIWLTPLWIPLADAQKQQREGNIRISGDLPTQNKTPTGIDKSMEKRTIMLLNSQLIKQRWMEAGEIVTLDESHAKKLVKEGQASPAPEYQTNVVPTQLVAVSGEVIADARHVQIHKRKKN